MKRGRNFFIGISIVIVVACVFMMIRGTYQKPPVYAVIEISMQNPQQYALYVEKVHDIVIAHKGRYRVRGGKIMPLSGNWNPERLIIIEFESLQHALQCFNSPEYKQIAYLREQSTSSKALIAEGL